MIPITLILSGFLSYQDPVEVDFSTFELACISGRNGAGKSALLDAITWALFGRARHRGEAIVNNQSDQADVRLIFRHEGNLYRVLRANPRGGTSSLEFQIAQDGEQDPDKRIWKPLTERTIRDTQERIEETLRLDYETFVNASFFLQGKADQFTQQRPSDRKRILASILGLEIWETYRKRALERRKAIEAEITTLDGRLSEINAELGEETARKQRLKELEAELERLANARQAQSEALEGIKKSVSLLEEQRKAVESMAQRLEAAQTRRDGLTSKLAARDRERESHAETIEQADEIEAAYQAWQDSREALARWDETAEQFREQEKRRQEPLTAIEAERARLKQERDNLQEREAEIKEQESSLEDLESQIKELENRIAALEASVEKRDALQAALETARQRLANAKAENPRLKSEMETLKARIDQLTQAEEDASVCPLCEQPLSPEERARLIAELNEGGTEMGDRYRANRALLDEADALVTSLQEQIAAFDPVEEDLRAATRQLDQVTSQKEGIETAVAQWQTEGAPRLAEIETALEEDDFAPDARAELEDIDADLKAIGYDAAAHDAVRRAEREGRGADDAHRELEKARAAVEPLEREIASLDEQRTELEEEIETLGEEHAAAQAALAEAEESLPDLRQAQRDLLDLQEEENQLRMEVGAARQKVLVLDDLKERRQALEAERQELAERVGRLEQLEEAFGKNGVPALLIEQALPQIEARANDILDRLSGGDMSVRFRTQRELKSRDALKETLDIQISDSAGVRDYEMYSGGEAFRVNFAIRLALSEMLAQRAGARLQTLVIDEGFGSQDEIGRQRLIEAINLVKPDFAKILVITHIDSLKDAFPARIEVEKTPQGSRVEII
jgi:exonuclease SbcC